MQDEANQVGIVEPKITKHYNNGGIIKHAQQQKQI